VSDSEFDIIQRWFARDQEHRDGLLLGVGDDAAVLECRGRIAVCVDTLVADVHFPASAPADAIGHRALAVNLSDIAAMAARPRWCTLTLTMPQADEGWLDSFTEAFFALAREHGTRLVGGDLSRGPLSVTVQVIGEVGENWLRRSGARPGDDIYITGTPGDSAAGLAVMRDGTADKSAAHAALVARFLRPVPRVQEGLALAGLASSAIDVSDGLLADLGHICNASGCAAVVDVEQLPLSESLLSVCGTDAARQHALAGGDDYELCFTASPERAAEIEQALAALSTPVQRIGEIQSGSGVVATLAGKAFEPPIRGYTHF
jgi:thiamine-monophosphate kinase